MAKIKTRNTIKSSIKAVGKTASIGEHMKRTYARTKSHIRSNTDADHDSPEEYADDQLTQGTERITREGVTQTKRLVKHNFRTEPEKAVQGPPPTEQARQWARKNSQLKNRLR